jgi:hypothetical protein
MLNTIAKANPRRSQPSSENTRLRFELRILGSGNPFKGMDIMKLSAVAGGSVLRGGCTCGLVRGEEKQYYHHLVFLYTNMNRLQRAVKLLHKVFQRLLSANQRQKAVVRGQSHSRSITQCPVRG